MKEYCNFYLLIKLKLKLEFVLIQSIKIFLAYITVNISLFQFSC